MKVLRQIKFPVLSEKRLEIVGGNHIGYFISKVNFDTQDFCVADKLLSVSRNKLLNYTGLCKNMLFLSTSVKENLKKKCVPASYVNVHQNIVQWLKIVCDIFRVSHL